MILEVFSDRSDSVMLIYDFFDIYDSQGKPGYDLEMFPLWNKVKKF